MFQKTDNTCVGGFHGGQDIVVINNVDDVRIKVKNKPFSFNHFDHTLGVPMHGEKVIRPGTRTVEIDIRNNGGHYPPEHSHPREQPHKDAFVYDAPPVHRSAPPVTVDRTPSQDDALGRTALELNKVRDLTELNFKPDSNGVFKANVQGVFKNGFSKVFNEDPAFAQKLLGSDALRLSEDRESIVLMRPMSTNEMAAFEHNAAAIGRLKRGDLRRAHEIFDTQGPLQIQENATGTAPSAGNGANTGSQTNESVTAAQAATAQAQADAQHAREAAKLAQEQARAMADALKAGQQESQHTASKTSLSPQDRIAIAQVILAKLGYDLGPKGIDGAMGHHDAKGGFTGRAIESFKEHDVGFAPPKNADLTDHTFDRLIQRYQGLQGKNPSGLLDQSTVTSLIADQEALHAKGVKVSHPITSNKAVEELATVQAPRNPAGSDVEALQAKFDSLAKQLSGTVSSKSASVSEGHIVPPSATPVLKTAVYAAR